LCYYTSSYSVNLDPYMYHNFYFKLNDSDFWTYDGHKHNWKKRLDKTG